MIENPVKAALARDEAVFGVGLTGPVALPTLRILANAGVEWLFADLEHGSLDIHELLNAVQIADMLGMVSVPRIPSLDYHWVARSLDTGALSLMVPRVETAEQAAQAVSWARYPPEGTRGMGSPSRLSYAEASIAECAEITNRELLMVLQIESQLGVNHAEAIAAVPGVDVLFIGPLDLSLSLGHPGETTHEESLRCYRHVCEVARAQGVGVGIVCPPDQVRFFYDMGIRLLSCGSTVGFTRAGAEEARATFDAQLA